MAAVLLCGARTRMGEMSRWRWAPWSHSPPGPDPVAPSCPHGPQVCPGWLPWQGRAASPVPWARGRQPSGCPARRMASLARSDQSGHSNGERAHRVYTGVSRGQGSRCMQLTLKWIRNNNTRGREGENEKANVTIYNRCFSIKRIWCSFYYTCNSSVNLK